MRGIQDDAQPLHFLEQLPAKRRQPARVVRSLGISSRAVMGRADCPQPLLVGLLKVCRGADGIGPFQAEDVPDRGVGGRPLAVALP